MCAAHWAALSTAVELLGGLAACTGPLLRCIVADICSVANNCRPLLTDASMSTMLSKAVARAAPKLCEVRVAS